MYKKTRFDRFHVSPNDEEICKQEAYTVAFSGGVTNGGLGYFSSNICVITSESATHFPSNFITGTLPSGLISRNLNEQNKL
jgi:hypothetical protein